MRTFLNQGGVFSVLCLGAACLGGCSGSGTDLGADDAATATSALASGDDGDDGDDCEIPDGDNSKKAFKMAMYGDAPYGVSPTDNSQTLATPGFISAVNADPDVSVIVHVGDTHSGKQYCTEAYNRTVFDMWTAFADPLIYTPGDNEWADCHKVAEGGGAYDATTGAIKYVVDASGNPVDYAQGNPLANLDLVRSIFFSRPGRTLGGGKKKVLSQAQCGCNGHPKDKKFVENVIWKDSGVLFVAINLPGGSNNDNDIWYGTPAMSAAQADEIVDRTDADLRWLDRAFSRAQQTNTKAVVIIAQADMWDPEKGAAHQAAYEPFVLKIATLAATFGKPVLMFNGDSHVYQSGNPLVPSNTIHPGYDVPNFHRVVVHGSTTPLEYLRLSVDPRQNAPHGTEAFGPFSWERVAE